MDANSLFDEPLTRNICRTCLVEIESNTNFTNIKDSVQHEMAKVKLIDILVYMNCLENNFEDNWPQAMCSSCVTTALMAYSFKLSCHKANSTLSQLLSIRTSPTLTRSEIDPIDINVVYQDHEYDVPLFANPLALDYKCSSSETKEVIPLPPVSEITATEQPMRIESEKKYPCNVCSRSFTRLHSLKYHIVAKHVDIRKHLCPKCGKGFHTSGGLRQHILSHREVGQFKCGFCSKHYKSHQSLKEHFRVAHSGNRYSFVCVLCGKSFTAKSTLLMHTKSHNSEKQFACPECPKTYTRSSYLKLHRLKHSGEERPRPYSCKHEDCDRSFTTKNSLVVHVAHAHSSERPYKCDICYKSFPTVSGLRTHKESHSAREVSCNICGKQVTNKRVLKKHLKVHDLDIDSTEFMFENIVNNSFFDHIY